VPKKTDYMLSLPEHLGFIEFRGERMKIVTREIHPSGKQVLYLVTEKGEEQFEYYPRNYDATKY
jgi:hypothetical protein